MPNIIKLTWDTIIDLDEIYDKITSNDRWTISHERVFKYEDKFYKTYYDKGATEYQDGCGVGLNDELECIEVKAVEVKTIKYVPV